MSIFWLTGLAGTGKSTITKTFCQRISSNNSFLLASFFASRSSAERRDPHTILHTLAYELATSSDLIRPHVLSAVRAPQHISGHRQKCSDLASAVALASAGQCWPGCI
jgi:hypothetical protein